MGEDCSIWIKIINPGCWAWANHFGHWWGSCASKKVGRPPALNTKQYCIMLISYELRKFNPLFIIAALEMLVIFWAVQVSLTNKPLKLIPINLDYLISSSWVIPLIPFTNTLTCVPRTSVSFLLAMFNIWFCRGVKWAWLIVLCCLVVAPMCTLTTDNKWWQNSSRESTCLMWWAEIILRLLNTRTCPITFTMLPSLIINNYGWLATLFSSSESE